MLRLLRGFLLGWKQSCLSQFLPLVKSFVEGELKSSSLIEYLQSH